MAIFSTFDSSKLGLTGRPSDEWITAGQTAGGRRWRWQTSGIIEFILSPHGAIGKVRG
jgi:hypothetical protein